MIRRGPFSLVLSSRTGNKERRHLSTNSVPFGRSSASKRLSGSAAYCFLVGVKTHEENNMADQFKCSKCGKTFSSQSELKEHEKNCNKK